MATLIEMAMSCNGTFWRTVGRCLEAKLLIMKGEFGAGIAQLRSELEGWAKIGWAVWYPEFLGLLAEGQAGLGRFLEAFSTIDQALAKADQGGERQYLAELLRIKGDLLLRESGGQAVTKAQDCFLAAVDVARQQSALLFELRATMSLARSMMAQGRRSEAKQILMPMYARFTEGFETVDLRNAREILNDLASA